MASGDGFPPASVPPTAEGFYWFEGTSAFERRRPDHRPRLGVVEVRNTSQAGKPLYVLNGAFMYPKDEGYVGRWERLPDPSWRTQDEATKTADRRTGLDNPRQE